MANAREEEKKSGQGLLLPITFQLLQEQKRLLEERRDASEIEPSTVDDPVNYGEGEQIRARLSEIQRLLSTAPTEPPRQPESVGWGVGAVLEIDGTAERCFFGSAEDAHRLVAAGIVDCFSIDGIIGQQVRGLKAGEATTYERPDGEKGTLSVRRIVSYSEFFTPGAAGGSAADKA